MPIFDIQLAQWSEFHLLTLTWISGNSYSNSAPAYCNDLYQLNNTRIDFDLQIYTFNLGNVKWQTQGYSCKSYAKEY